VNGEEQAVPGGVLRQVGKSEGLFLGHIVMSSCLLYALEYKFEMYIG